MVLRLCTGRRTIKCCGTKVKRHKVDLKCCMCNRVVLYVRRCLSYICTCHAHNACTTVPVLQVERCFSDVPAIHTEELQLSLALMELHLSRCTVSGPRTVVIKNVL